MVTFVRTLVIHTSSLRHNRRLSTVVEQIHRFNCDFVLILDQERITNHSAQLTQAVIFKITIKVLVIRLYLSEILSVKYRSMANLKIWASLSELLRVLFCV